MVIANIFNLCRIIKVEVTILGRKTLPIILNSAKKKLREFQKIKNYLRIEIFTKRSILKSNLLAIMSVHHVRFSYFTQKSKTGAHIFLFVNF